MLVGSVNKIIELTNTGQWQNLSNFFAPNFKNHSHETSLDDGKSVVFSLEEMKHSLPDLKFEVKSIAEDMNQSCVLYLCNISGTHNGSSFMGLAPLNTYGSRNAEASLV